MHLGLTEVPMKVFAGLGIRILYGHIHPGRTPVEPLPEPNRTAIRAFSNASRTLSACVCMYPFPLNPDLS